MKSYFYTLLLSVSFVLLSLPSQATHLRGGYINYRLDKDNPRKAFFKMIIYNKDSSPADDPFVLIDMGDGEYKRVKRLSKSVIQPDVKLSTYEWEYTFPSAGTYNVAWNNENRNNGILNMAQPSDQISLAIRTEIIINPLQPNLHGVKIEKTLPIMGHVGEPLRFNLIAYDLDGDSLGYELVAPLHRDYQKKVYMPVPGHTIPEGFGITPYGEIYWDNPTAMGEYVFAVKITQYRKGRPMGHTILDMQYLITGENPYQSVPKVIIDNKEELTFLEDGRLLVKPGEKLTLRLKTYQYDAFKTWQSELLHLGIDDIESNIISPYITEFTFTATKELARRFPYGVNFEYEHSIYNRLPTTSITFTLPILIWQPEEVKLEVLEPENLTRTAEGHIKSTPGSDTKILLYAKNGLGNKTEFSVESDLRKGAEHFSFVTRDSADSVVGELRFKPSASQVSAIPYTITLRSTSLQLRTSAGTTGNAQEVTLQVLVSEITPLSSESDLVASRVVLYPNPSTDNVSIDAPQLPALYLQLHDANGRKVSGYTLQPGQKNNIDTKSLPKGLYFYTLTSRGKQVSNGKVLLL